MKNLLPIILLFGIISFQSKAATNITTATVSGHWTMSGSPYKIFNDINVASGSSLTIDPGVEVVFQGMYSLLVDGALYAVGTPGSPIKFRAQDTTGWHDDLSAAGGWRGIRLADSTVGMADITALAYCNITDIKFGGVSGGIMGTFEVDVRRKLDIGYCNFYHNMSVAGGMYLIQLSGDVRFTNCNVYNNKAALAVILMFMLNNQQITDCNIYNNLSDMHIISAVSHTTLTGSSVLLIDRCNIYQNQSTGDIAKGAIITVSGNEGNVVVRKSKIHHNTQKNEATINCLGGNVDINGNLICNNAHTVAGSCGPSEGGGGIRLHSSLGYTNYTVRNNIIANNYSAFYGGGIYVWHSRAKIINNTIINNSVPNTAYEQGPGICLIQDTFRTYIKNNILYNNRIVGTPSSPNVFSLNNSPIIFENNWLQRPVYSDISDYAGSILYYGDTLTNVIGSSPNLTAPTLTASETENAVPANFSLLSSSYCINTGDTVAAVVYSTDYNNANRIAGAGIDIGACEFAGFCADTISGAADICIGGTVTLGHAVPGGTWSSPHASLFVNVNPATGVVTGISGGVATIYYTVGGCLASVKIKVHSLPTTIDGPGNVCIASSITLVSFPSGGVWSATNSTATISAMGVVTPVLYGVDTFYYSYSDICGSTVISHVVNIDTLPASITGTMSVCQGQSATLSNSTGGGVWLNMDFGSTFINPYTGVYTGSVAGSWDVIYRLPTGCSTYATVTVNTTPTIYGYTSNACIGVLKPLSASVTGGTWASGDVAMATINVTTGVAMGVSPGTVNITYTTPQGCSESVVLTIANCPTGFQAVAWGNEMKVYPNPAQDRVSISLPYIAGVLTIRDVIGVKVAERQVAEKDNTFDLSKLSHGMYIVVWEKGDSRDVQKIVVE